MPKPMDSLSVAQSAPQKEELGISLLDEPCLNGKDKAALEMEYIAFKNISGAVKEKAVSV